MTRRIGAFEKVAAIASASYRRMAVELGGPARALGLHVSKPPSFTVFPENIHVGNSAHGLKILDGRFVLGSQSLDVGTQGNPWVIPAPSKPFAHKLHSFHWLSDLSAIMSDGKLLKKSPQITKKVCERACQLCDSWTASFGKWNAYAWGNTILVERIYNWLVNWRVLLSEDTDQPSGAARRASLYRQIKRLRSTYKRTPAGILRLKAAACLVMSGVCFSDQRDLYLNRGLDLLDDEIEIQILPDGGHISRNPEMVAQALEILISVESVLERQGLEGSKEIRRAIDRLYPMRNFFATPDGGSFGFNGGGTGQNFLLKKITKRRNITSKPFGYAPHTKYQRLDQNGTVLMIDVGGSPPRPYDIEAHIAPLSFELATDAGRLVVNCGWNNDQPQHWRQPMRGTAAHSTLILNQQDVGGILDAGLVARALGHAISQSAGPVNCIRKEQEAGTWLEASHDGYCAQYGLTHQRRIYMDILGRDIRGEDRLFVPLGAAPIISEEIPFQIRFHLHPDVKVTLAQDQKSALLIQNGGYGWRFRTDAGPLRLEKSVYLADGNKPIRCEQIVISGHAYGDGDGQTRSNRVRWSFKRMGIV